jgi:hypothetical protein
MYPHTLPGLGKALAMGLPFYRNDLTSTTLTLDVLRTAVLARQMARAMEAAQNDRVS